MVQAWAMGSHSVSPNRSNASSRQSGMAHGFKLARAAFFVLAFAILFGGLTLVRTFAAGEQVEPASGSEMVIYADTGDTLWKLAASVKKPSMDIREAVYLLMKRNQLSSSSIESGQSFIVPAEMLP